MEPVQISPEVQAQEMVAFEFFLRNRVMIHGQTIANLKAELASFKTDASSKVAAMEAQLQEAMQRLPGGSCATDNGERAE